VSNLPFGSGASTSKRQRLTRSTSAPLRDGPQQPVSGQLCGRTDGGVGEHLPGSCCLTAYRRSLLGPSCSHWGTGPSSRSAYPTPTGAGTPARVTTFHTRETRPGRAPSSSRDGGALPAGPRTQPAPAASQRPVLFPATTSHLAGMTVTRRHQGFTHVRRPVFSWSVAPGWNGNPWTFP
jgi:hypothetical protein